jgi:arsenate reductase
VKKSSILFLCTGNSCRSQIAEGLANHFLGNSWEADSAGTEPAGYIHPMAIEVMAEIGIDISHHRSKSVYAFRGSRFDLVITVCDAAAENCPVWLGPGRVVHQSFPDPAQAQGTESEKLAVFRRVRDDIRKSLLPLLEGETNDLNANASD